MFGPMGPMQMAQVNGTPQKCAMVNASTNIVENLIVADPEVDPAPEGTILVGLPDDSPVAVGWLYDPATSEFTDPYPPAPVEAPIP